MLGKIIEYCRGTMRISISGPHCEQVLNVLTKKEVSFRRLQRIDEQNVCVTIYERDYEMLSAICSRYSMQVKLVKHHSVGVLTNRYRRRWGLLCGVVIGGILLLGINCFVWDVQVTGCDVKTSEGEILRQFEELGFGIGSFRFGWDLTDLENKFMMQNKEVIWVSVNLQFTTAQIELQERSVKEEKVYDMNTPCDIYAARDGQIVSMMVSSGTPLVQEGDAVRAGEKLVSREYISKYGETIIVRSIATVTAKTTRVLLSEQPLRRMRHQPTGQSKTFFDLQLFNFKIPLYFKENISYNNYDYTEKRTVLRLGKHLALPFSIITRKYTEVTYETENVSVGEARLAATIALEQMEKAQLFETEILDKKIEETIAEDGLVLTATYRCLEDIAQAIGE